MFIFNTQLLLIDIGSVWELLLTIFSALGAMLVFAAATQGFWLTKTKWYETVGLLLIAFTSIPSRLLVGYGMAGI